MSRPRRDATIVINCLTSAMVALTAVIVIEFLVRYHLHTLESWWVLGGIGP